MSFVKYSVLITILSFFGWSSIMGCHSNHSLSLHALNDTTVSLSPASPTNTSQDSAETKNNVSAPGGNFTYKIIDADSATYGYDIYNGGKLLIHQPSIPALPGNKGFELRETAGAVAQLVITKISKGEMPPTISEEELKNLGVSVKK